MTNEIPYEIPYEIPPELERFIHKLHLRTFDKIMPHVTEKYPNATQKYRLELNEDLHIVGSFK